MNLKYYFYELWSLFVDHGLPLIALLPVSYTHLTLPTILLV